MQQTFVPERSSARLARLLVAVGVVALLSGALFGASSASTALRAGSRPDAVVPAPAAESPEAVRRAAARLASPFAQPGNSFAAWSAPAALLFSGPETVNTFAADCHTSSASFNVGDTICVAVSGTPAGTPALRRLYLIDPEGKVRDSSDITNSSASVSFTLPSDATFDIPGCDPDNGEPCSIDNRGVWRIVLADTSEVATQALALFVVHDPSRQVTDLSVAKVLFDVDAPSAGNNVTYRIFVHNNGPDAAQNVRFSDATPPNTTFVSFTQDDGPAFTCTPPAVGSAGTTNCTRSSLLKGESATFTAVYLVSTGIADGGDLTDTLTVNTDTFDRHTADNSSTASETASNATPPSCSISCPANISQDSDPNQAGAVVTFNDPTTTGSCSAVSCDHPSGSFFPVGSTSVKCSDTTNQFSCNFVVTINDKRTVKVTLNGAADVTVECNTGFTDPGATASDKDGNSLPVTTSVTIPDPGGAVDSNGDAVQVPVSGVDPNSPNTYTITYSATDGTTTSTAKRVVHVVDTTPPVITLAGTSGFTVQTEQVTVTNDDGTTSVVTETILVGTVECHSNFTAPTATAADGCDNHAVPVTTTGSVDANTPGTYEIAYDATDAAGNDAETRVRVTVVDTTAPTITAPPAVTLNTGPGATSCGVTVSDLDAALGTATASDSCSSSVGVTRSGVPAGNTFTGTTTITYTATDATGNHSSATQTVTVVDNTPPTITAPPAITVNADPATCATNVSL
ncbi:MAG TPA: immunoglobulin-like domain-containing protein, partial [Pyrinomonadaceae bacterium]|nr:immunoglobulin-like domain-containing protein [Pyrinomonadaceae bacterium]